MAHKKAKVTTRVRPASGCLPAFSSMLVVMAIFAWACLCCSGPATDAGEHGVVEITPLPVPVTVPTPALPPTPVPQSPRSAAMVFFEDTMWPIIEWQAANHPLPYVTHRLSKLVAARRNGEVFAFGVDFRPCSPYAIACVESNSTGPGLIMSFYTPYFMEHASKMEWGDFMDEVVAIAMHEELHIELGHFEERQNDMRQESEVRWRIAQNVVEPSFAHGRFAKMSPETRALYQAYLRSHGSSRSVFWEGYIDSIAR